MPGSIKACWKKIGSYLSGLNPGSPREILTKARTASSDRLDRLSAYLAGFRQTNFEDIARKLFETQTLGKLLITFVALFGSLYVLDKADPFGISRAAQSYSESLFQKVTSSFYGSSAQDRIAVVLIDERTLESRGESWPPRYTYYDEVVRRIAKQKPVAIFLDILVEGRRTYDDSLDAAKKALGDTLAESKVPLYLATLDGEHRSIFAEVPGTDTALAGWSGYGHDYPLLVGDGNLFENSDPQLEHDEQCSNIQHATAAFQLYWLICAKGMQAGCPSELAQGDTSAFCSPLAIQWGRNVSKVVPERQLISESQCTANEGSLWEKTSDSLASMFAALISGIDRESAKRDRQPCPYAVTVREEDLATEKARGVLQGRVVLIGTSLNGIHDMVESPVHGQIPGVYLHAMALDNLLTWNADYYKRADGDLTLLGLALVIAWLAVGLIRANPPRLNFLLHAMAIILLLATMATFYFVLHRPPLDWLGFLLVYELVKRLIEKNERHATQAEIQEGTRNELG